MQDCIFCKIIRGEIPCKKVYEDAQTLAFYDIAPQAPMHVVIIPKVHMVSVLEVPRNSEHMAALHTAALAVAEQLNLKENGFRLVINTGRDGGQTVAHLHVHLLAGRGLAWPPG